MPVAPNKLFVSERYLFLASWLYTGTKGCSCRFNTVVRKCFSDENEWLSPHSMAQYLYGYFLTQPQHIILTVVPNRNNSSKPRLNPNQYAIRLIPPIPISMDPCKTASLEPVPASVSQWLCPRSSDPLLTPTSNYRNEMWLITINNRDETIYTSLWWPFSVSTIFSSVRN